MTVQRYGDRVAIVTGAATGFGEATAVRFAAEGASVVVADLDAARGRDTVRQIRDAGGRAVFAEADVSQSSDVKKTVETALGEFAGLDVIVNNAGIAHRSMPMTELPESDYDRVFEVNVKSVYLFCVHGVPALIERGGGAIVNIASIGASRPRPNVTAYNATKGAVVTLTRGLAVELAPDKIRVNAVNPLAAETNFMKGKAMRSEPGSSFVSSRKGLCFGGA